MQTGIWFESLIERDYMYLLEIDPDVESYRSQPLTISYTISNKQLKYTPDFLVKRKKFQQIVEIKPESKVHSPKNIRLFRCVAPLCQEQGYSFVVVTDKMIRVQPLLDNVKLLYRYAREPLTYKNYIDCHQYFKERISTSLQAAQQDLTTKQISFKILMKLIFSGVLETDLMKPINSESLITRTKVQLSP
ncbi:TnsA endonuclease N-terminal domain-containing protein [[Phormidium] sp. LEGE 05292]|uniref:TnsA endonuclease N-terminal domain-containing protein n=1 Tax=[Phormidium] sp. LEGE 05292 TaxID=767427 RepID=UPI001D15344B|nr:TnsA endonuclease N-terminal domain-containing protein [Phormidium sp. LEGE 05292]